MTPNEYGVSFRREENVLKIDGDGYTTLIMLQKYQIVYFKGRILLNVNYISIELLKHKVRSSARSRGY